MHKTTYVFISVILYGFLFLQSCRIPDVTSSSQPVSHEIWDSLLKLHVSEDGWVDYRGFKSDSLRLNKYLELLGNNHPNENNWTRDEQLVYWINAYNAFTIKLVADHYPVASIKDIKNGVPFVNTVWDIKFIKIEDQVYDLNNIEHGILRPKFDEPRIHFAINCASVSCPPLANYAYHADDLDDQLALMARRFLADKRRNRIESAGAAELSKIFSWFRGDFTKNQSLISYINQYAPVQLDEKARIDFLEYDWNINSQDSN